MTLYVETIYRSSIYIGMWILFYIIARFVFCNAIDEIDAALIASIAVVIYCIGVNIYTSRTEHYSVSPQSIDIQPPAQPPTAQPPTAESTAQPTAQPTAESTAQPPTQLPTLPPTRASRELQISKNMINNMAVNANDMDWDKQKLNHRSYTRDANLDQIRKGDGKTQHDLLTNEIIYSDFNRLPPSFNKFDFEPGYSYLPPKDWYPIPPYPPVCAATTMNVVSPIYVDMTTMDLKDWYQTVKFTASESITH